MLPDSVAFNEIKKKVIKSEEEKLKDSVKKERLYSFLYN
jgi:hypothetical protein